MYTVVSKADSLPNSQMACFNLTCHEYKKHCVLLFEGLHQLDITPSDLRAAA